jgi:serine/threonine protein kinase
LSELTGKTLKNQYFLRQLIGSGGMADVYEAWDNLRATRMAVKVLRRDLALSSKFFQAFEKEAKFLGDLQHPNIVRLFDFVREDPVVFIVMNWIEGINLKQRLNSLGQPMDPDEAGRILRPVCSALHFAHQMKVYHCDIKPSNILLHENGRDVFLSDFGVARLASERGGGGTLPYMAPEQFVQGVVNAQTDIYSLGITLFEMLSGGQAPFKGDSEGRGSTLQARFAWEHMNKPLPSLREHHPSLPDSMISVVEKALDKDARKRFTSAMELWDDFERARGGKAAAPGDGTVLWQAPPTSLKPKSQPAIAPRPPTTPPPKPGTLHLFGRAGEWAGRHVLIPKQGLTIGRGQNNQLRIQERSVSRQHATILVMRSGIYVRDEGSALGTYVNGQRIAARVPVPLKHGDVIQTGYYQVFELRSQ